MQKTKLIALCTIWAAAGRVAPGGVVDVSADEGTNLVKRGLAREPRKGELADAEADAEAAAKAAAEAQAQADANQKAKADAEAAAVAADAKAKADAEKAADAKPAAGKK